MAKTQEKQTEAGTVQLPSGNQANAQTGEIATHQSTAVALADGNAVDFFADAGAGQEGTTRDDYAIPFISILQGLSPAVVDNLIEGARPGLFVQSVSQELAEKVVLIPCAYARRFIEWAPRSKGGGFKGEHLPLDIESGKVPTEEKPDDKGVLRLFHKNGNELKDTRTHYCLQVKADGSFTPVVVSFGSTQIRKSKRWLGVIAEQKARHPATQELFTLPSFAVVYEASSVKESNERGTWFGWSIGKVGPVPTKELYEAAKAFNKMVLEGSVKASYEAEGDGQTVDEQKDGAF